MAVFSVKYPFLGLLSCMLSSGVNFMTTVTESSGSMEATLVGLIHVGQLTEMVPEGAMPVFLMTMGYSLVLSKVIVVLMEGFVVERSAFCGLMK